MNKRDAVELAKRVKDRQPDREKVMFYISKSLYQRFREACEGADLPVPDITEELIRTWLDAWHKN